MTDQNNLISSFTGEETQAEDERMSLSMIEANAKSSLHEIIMAEKMDFEAKLERMARRKQWLKAHQQLIRTLLSYSVLHGSCGGGLASVRMELILLLQVDAVVACRNIMQMVYFIQLFQGVTIN